MKKTTKDNDEKQFTTKIVNGCLELIVHAKEASSYTKILRYAITKISREGFKTLWINAHNTNTEINTAILAENFHFVYELNNLKYYAIDLTQDNFPYKQIDVNFMIKNLKNLKNDLPTIDNTEYTIKAVRHKTGIIPSTYKNKFVRIVTAPTTYEQYNILTDYFNEKSRMLCTFNNYISPNGYFHKYSDKIINDIKQNKMEVSLHNIREKIYEDTKECNTFGVTTAAFIYDFLNAKYVLDFSAGWGDRLLGAIALDIDYIGIDPNINNHTGYNKSIKLAGNPKKQQVLRCGAEYVNKNVFKNKKIDLIFTSPPFFDYEVYANVAQSTNTYADCSQCWFVFFLCATVMRLAPYLQVNGNLALYIQDTSSVVMCEPFVLFMSSYFPNFRFDGIISHGLPIFIFNKTSNTTKQHNEKMKQTFEKNYRQSYSLCKILIKPQTLKYYDVGIRKEKIDNYCIINDCHISSVLERAFFKVLTRIQQKKIVHYGLNNNDDILAFAKVCHLFGKEFVYVCPKNEMIMINKQLTLVTQCNKIKKAHAQYDMMIDQIDYDFNKNHIAALRKHVTTTYEDAFIVDALHCDESFVNVLTETLRESLNIIDINTELRNTIYLSVHNTGILQALYRVFKYANFCVVSASKIDDDIIQHHRTVVIEKSRLKRSKELKENKIKGYSKARSNIWKYFKRLSSTNDICWLH